MKKLFFNAIKNNRFMLGVKWVATISLLAILYFKVFKTGHYSIELFVDLFKSLVLNSTVLIILLVLVLVNWFSDTFVWYKSVNSIQKVTFFDALKNNIISQYLGIIVPFGLGEYGGKTALFKEAKQKKESLVVTLSYRLSKAWAKWVVGCIALSYILLQKPFTYLHLLILIPVALTLLVFFKSAFMYRLLFKLRFFDPETEAEINTHHLKVYKTFLPALLKFLSYCFQFALILIHTEETGFVPALIVGVIIYAVASFFPQASFFDPFIKGGIGVFLTPYAIADQTIMFASTVVWILNAGIPSLIGAILWFKPKSVPKA